MRAVPEILAWPYPIGSDPIQFYAPALSRGLPSGFLTPKNSFLYWFLQDLLFRYVIRDSFLVVKLMGPLIQATLALALYVYAVRVMRWNRMKAFWFSFLATSYFVALAISWTWYRMMLGTVFMFLTLIAMRSRNIKVRRIGSPIFAILTLLSHEVTAVFMIIILLGGTMRLALRRDLSELLRSLTPLVVAFGLFLFQHWDPARAILCVGGFFCLGGVGWFSLQPAGTGGTSMSILWAAVGFSLYAYLPLIPLIAYGATKLRAPQARDWLLFTVIVAGWTIVFLSPNFEAFVIRVIMFSVYPLGLFFTHGLERWMSREETVPVVTLEVRRISGVALVLLLLVLSFQYAASPPENAFPYFSQYNPFLTYLPSSMLQTSMSLTDMRSAMNVTRWLDRQLDNQTYVIVLEPFRGIAAVSLPQSSITTVWYQGSGRIMLAGLVLASRNATLHGYTRVYTIWWIPGEGWWGITSLPKEFIMTYSSGRIAAYLYSP
jgi:hypothetical protein